MNRVKLAIIEDIEDIRHDLQDFFNKEAETECVLAVSSMEAFFGQINTLAAPPDIILSDIGLPGMNGIEGVKSIKTILPGVDVVMLTVFNDSDRIFRSLCAGACGYILKSTDLSEIKKAILDVRAGGSYMTPSIARKVVEYFFPVRSNSEPFAAIEMQIIQGLTDGLSYKMIAAKLSVTIDSVRFHIKNIYRKLHVNSKGEVIRKMLKGEV